MRVCAVRTGIVVEVSPADRVRLEAVVADRKSPQKHFWRARIVLLTSDGCGTAQIMRRRGKAKTAVCRWQERFMQAGVDGLLRDKTRFARIRPLAAEVAERVVALTLARGLSRDRGDHAASATNGRGRDAGSNR